MAPHGKCGDASHHHENEDLGIQYSLYSKIDRNNLECLNESREGSGKTVFKPWEDRHNFTDFVESDADEELLFYIPFTGNVKLKGIRVIGDDSNSHPAIMRLFKNKPGLTFEDTNIPADQEFELVRDNIGAVEYGTKVVTFSNVHHLSIHFPTNFGANTTKIYYIGLKGEFSEARHHGVTICTYEARPMAEDHTNPLDNLMNIHPSVG